MQEDLLQLYLFTYYLSTDSYVRTRYCLAHSLAHSLDVFIRSLIDEGINIDDILYDYPVLIPTYR